MNDPFLIRTEDLQVHFYPRGRVFRRDAAVKAVDGVDLEIRTGEVCGLVGESGSGKSTLGRAILRLVRPTSGRVVFDGEDLARVNRSRLRQLRQRIQIVFQDPYSSLNPRMQIGEIIGEPMRFHGLASRGDLERAVKELLEKVGLDKRFVSRYPHEFSGGQRQRVAIARALATNPDFIVADEPVSALDVSVQAQILNLLLRLQIEKGITMLFISHDIAVVERISDRIAVMKGGKIVEAGSASDIVTSPSHAYTRKLIGAAKQAERRLG